MAISKITGSGLGAITQDGAATFNEASADVDFRVESNGNANMLFVDGGTDTVMIGTTDTNFNAGADDLIVGTGSGDCGITIYTGSSAGHKGSIFFGDTAAGDAANSQKGQISYEQNNEIMTFLTNNTLTMQMDLNGHVTMPRQPAFSAKVNSQINNLSVGGSSNTTIPFAAEIFDQNADYNTNGTFTAPVTGKYSLSFHLRLESIDTATTTYDFAINTGNRNYTHRFDPDFGDSDTLFYHVNLTVLADMDASDTAHVEYFIVAGTAQTDIDADSYFMGHLVC